MSETVEYYPPSSTDTDDQTRICTTQFYDAVIVTNPNVAGGGNATSFSFTVPAHEWADGESINIEAKFVGFTSNGVPTETRYLDISDTVQTLQTEIASLLAMPNNVTKYLEVNGRVPIYRVGTHLYCLPAFATTHGSIAYDINNQGFPLSSFTDLGTPDFTKPITIGISHTLSQASANAVIKCLGAQITHYKLT